MADQKQNDLRKSYIHKTHLEWLGSRHDKFESTSHNSGCFGFNKDYEGYKHWYTTRETGKIPYGHVDKSKM